MEIHNIVQEALTKITPKWLSEEALQVCEKRREVKGKGEGKDIHNLMQSSKE